MMGKEIYPVIKSNQKVSVHLMITIQKTDAQRLLITLYKQPRAKF